MINNYFILKAQSEFLNKELINYSVEDTLIVVKNCVTFILKSTKYRYLKIVLEKNLETLFLEETGDIPKKNILSIFPSIKSKLIKSVSTLDKNRVVTLLLSDGNSIVFYAVPNKSNIFIIKNGSIIDSYKEKSDFIGKNVESLINKPQESSQDLPHSFKDLLKIKYNYLGKYYKQELEAKFSKIDKHSIDYNKIISEFISELIDSRKFYLYTTDNDIVPSLINLSVYSDFQKIEYENINLLIINFYRKYKSFQEKKEAKNKLLSKLNTDLKRTENKIENIKKAIDETKNSHLFKIIGDVLLANIHNIKFGNKFYEYIDENNEIHKIKLDPKLSAQENANHYYTKYKGLKRSVESLNRKLMLLISERELLLINSDKLEKEENIKILRKMDNVETKTSNTEKLPFRIFKLSDKFEVWVGKDSASNDLLTMKYTNQYDYWFHVRGFSGSHTTLKLLDKNQKPEKEYVIKAAEIAAYYSKARKGRNIPVAYTEKKYVKKKKGFKQGAVVMENEKIVFVNPAIPELL